MGKWSWLASIIIVGIFSIRVAAQTSDTAPNTIAVGIGFAVVLSVLLVLFAGYSLLSDRERDIVRNDVLQDDLDHTEQITVQTKLPMSGLDITHNRMPVERPEGDYRPYLVMELLESANSFLTVGERWVITPDDTPFIIGSQIGTDLRIIDMHVSNEHVRVEYDHQRAVYSLVDQNSSNGSRWDGDTMIKKRPYRMIARRDIGLEIAVSYGFLLYLDTVAHPVDELPPAINDRIVLPEIPSHAQLSQRVDAHLNWVSPETNAAQDMAFTHNVTIIGRGDNADAQINHHLISKTHAYVIWKDDQFWLLDTSSNGTWLMTGSRGRERVPQGDYVPLDADTSLVIEVVRDDVMIDFHYTVDTGQLDESQTITDKLPELPTGVRPLLHVVRIGDNEQRREVRISTSVITIGRKEANIVPLVQESVADEHAKIVWENGQFWVYDLSGIDTIVRAQHLRRTRMALDPNTIYPIMINSGRDNEILLEFYYHIKDDVSEMEMHHPRLLDHTQHIDTNSR